MEPSATSRSRRSFLAGFGAAFATLGLSPALAAADAAKAAEKAMPRKKITDPYVYKFSIGKFEAFIDSTSSRKPCDSQMRTNSSADSTIPSGVSP